MKIPTELNKNRTQQLKFRCVRSTNNETRVERNRSTSIPYGVFDKQMRRISRGYCASFFGSSF